METPSEICTMELSRLGQKAQPIVSICSLTFNHERCIAQALDGFLMQKTEFPFEIIVHDDCSTDRTADVIADYQRRFPGQISFIRQTENQRSKGRHSLPFALERARGRYVALCEGDDFWTDPRKLQKQVDLLEAHPECCGSFHAATIKTLFSSGEPQLGVSDPEAELVSAARLLHANRVYTCTAMVRREFLPVHLGPQFAGCAMGDWPRWILAAVHGPWINAKDNMAVYVVHPAGVWSQLSGIKQLENMIQMLVQMCPVVPAELRRDARIGLLSHCSRLATEGVRMNRALEIADRISTLIEPRVSSFEEAEWVEFAHSFMTAAAPIAVTAVPSPTPAEVWGLFGGVLDRLGVPGPRRPFELYCRRLLSPIYQIRGFESAACGNIADSRRHYFWALASDPTSARAFAYFALSRMGRLGDRFRSWIRRAVGHS